MPRPMEFAYLDELIQRYIDGESEQSLALAYGISRPTIRRRLIARGITPRNRSQSMSIRMSRTNVAQRLQMTTNAHKARRAMGSSVEELHAKALSRQRSLSKAAPLENDLLLLLEERGLACTPQLAVGAYNLDIGIHAPPIAVEIQWSSRPFSSRPNYHRKRTEYLLNQGWHVCYVLVNRMHPLRDAAADDIISWAKELGGSKPPRGQYRVIRGDGQFVAALSGQF